MPEGSSNTGFLARGGPWVVVQAVLMTAVLVLGPVCPASTPLGWGRGLLALLLGLAGAWFGIAGVIRLGRSRTAYPRPLEECQLVTDGIYGWVRHPLYTSVLALSLAWSAGWGSVAASIVTVGEGFFFLTKAKREEAWLRERFDDYEAYSRKVKRFVPGLW